MRLVYRLLADLVVFVHMAYALFIVFGLLAVLIGIWRRWEWIRSMRFRLLHLAMILFVVAESWLGFTCPLTSWEKRLRRLAGDESYQGDFIANAVHELLFFDFEPWVFTAVYTVFGFLVATTFFLAPPRRRPRDPNPSEQ